MNFEKIRKKNRKAISPVLATVILIAITLIAAIAIAGFVFGLFGSFTSSAQVSAQVTSCSVAAHICTVTLTNSGTSNTVVSACSLQDQGVSAVGALGGTTAVPAGQTTTGFTCSIALVHSSVGSQAVGSFSTTNGATVPFTGTWTT
ncbi:MAG: type IV pilin [Thaumarchaeota archaeon]|nr:type IV pilin [Nitrososphaerota archaeon]